MRHWRSLKAARQNRQLRGHSTLIQAIRHGDLEEIKSSIAQSQGTGQLDNETLASALCISCDRDRVEVVEHLLQFVSPKVRWGYGRTPLMYAKSRAVAAALINAYDRAEKRQELDAIDEDGKTALMYARSKEVAELLIHEGASLDKVDKQGYSALMYMLLEDRVLLQQSRAEIADLLISKGADIDAADPYGRTILMTAVWKNQLPLVQRLIDMRVAVNKQDSRGRNVLHHLCEDRERAVRALTLKLKLDEKALIEMLLKAGVNVNEAEAIEHKTPLHLAVSAHNSIHINAILGNRNVDCNVTEQRDKTALHIAAASGQDQVVKKLLVLKARVDIASFGGWTPLHLAAQYRSKAVDTVSLLLKHGADLNSKTKLNKTALHIAAEAGNIEIVKYFLDQRGLAVMERDASGNTPLLSAAKTAHKDIAKLLEPHSMPKLPETARVAAEGMRAVVLDFAPKQKIGDLLSPRRVFDLVYGSIRASPDRSVDLDPGQESHSKGFRWIHLPANNLSWCRRLLLKLLLEDGGIDADTFKALEKSFDHQHRGKHLHARYMRPICHLTPKVPKDASSTQHTSNLENGNTYTSEHSDNDSPGESEGPHRHERKTSSQKGVHPKRRGHDHNGSIDSIAMAAMVADELTSDNATLETSHATGGLDEIPDNLYMFMPYLHFESIRNRTAMQTAVDWAQKLDRPDMPKLATQADGDRATKPVLDRPLFSFKGRQPQARKREEKKQTIVDETLIHAHITSSGSDLQIRRTLDQFFYRTFDTSERDLDQVVYRHQKKPGMTKEVRENPNILMVDQLWMWVVSKDLIITSFPRRWDQDHVDPDGVLEGIVNDVNSPTRPRISDVYELAMVIAGHCFGWIDRRDFSHSETLFLDMFESSIGDAMETETRLFKEFEKASERASTWLKKIRGSHGETAMKRERFFQPWDLKHGDAAYDGSIDDSIADGTSSDPAFVQILLDIGEETRLLREVKDIRDELDMLKMIFSLQKKLVPEMTDHLLTILKHDPDNTSEQQRKLKRLHGDQMRHIDHPLRDIERMDRQAQRIYNSIRDLLDLKQKHANAMQATDTARQGKTLMVFTIVTVIFLPLSFLAAFFAINVSDFPRNSSGEQEMSLRYISKYVFGVGVIIALVCVVLAWSAEQLAIFSKDATAWAWRRLGWLGLIVWEKSKQKATKEQDGRTGTIISNDIERASYELNPELSSRPPVSQVDLERGEKPQRSETWE